MDVSFKAEAQRRIGTRVRIERIRSEGVITRIEWNTTNGQDLWGPTYWIRFKGPKGYFYRYCGDRHILTDRWEPGFTAEDFD